MKNTKLYPFIISLLIFASCEKVIPFKSDELKPKIVLYTNIHPDSLISCDIGMSYAVINSNNNPVQIKNANVKLLIDGEVSELLKYQEPPPDIYDYGNVSRLSKYVSNQYPEEGKEYSIEVEINEIGKVSGSGTIPPLVPLIRIDTQRVIINEYDYSYTVMRTKLVFKDPEGPENFYRLVIKQISGYYPGDRFKPYDPEIPVLVNNYTQNWIDSDDPLLFPREEEGLFENYESNEYLIFSDEKINGKEYELKFNLSFDGLNPDEAYYEFIHYEIQLQSINKALYYFLKSSGSQRYNEGDLFIEPVIVYSNIINGLGVFGSTNRNGKKIEYGKYPVEGILYEDPEDYYYYQTDD